MADKQKKVSKPKNATDIPPEERSEMNMEWEGNPPTSEATIPERAYYLWEKAGRPEGKSMEYWLQAEKEAKEDRARDH